jgi:hypothetical protein
MLKHRVALLLALPVLALGGCGGDSDEDKIKAIVNDGAEDPSTICDHMTKKLLDQVGGSVDACKKQAKQADDGNNEKPDKIDVKVDGDKATAKFKGSDGDDNNVTFVKDGGDWKVDAVA